MGLSSSMTTLGHPRLQVAVAAGVREVGLDLAGRLAGDHLVDAEQVVHPGLLGVLREAYLVAGVGDGAPEGALDLGRLVEHAHEVAPYVRVGLGHLDRRVVQPHHPGADLRDVRLGYDEGVPVQVVEPLGNVPRQLDVLPLVVADRHLVGIVQDDVRGHQHRIVEQARDHDLALGRLVLVLRHALKPADRRDAVQYPAALGVLGDVALDEESALVRVQAGSQVERGDVPRPADELFRVLGHGDGVQVDDAEEVHLLRLPLDPSLEGAQVVAQVQVSGRLDPAEYPAPRRDVGRLHLRGRLCHRAHRFTLLACCRMCRRGPFVRGVFGHKKDPSSKGRVFPWCHPGLPATSRGETASASLVGRGGRIA